MKELSIEEKAKRYDEIIKLVNSKWLYKNQPCVIDVSEIFSELKKNEDENIRKDLIDWVESYVNNTWRNHNKTDIIAWLKKRNTNNVNQQQTIDIPFGAKDSELQEATYYIPNGYHAEINGKEVIIKKDEQKTDVTQYCCILDFNTGKAFKHFITEDEANLNTVELLRKYGFKETECSVMYTSNNLELTLLEN